MNRTIIKSYIFSLITNEKHICIYQLSGWVEPRTYSAVLYITCNVKKHTSRDGSIDYTGGGDNPGVVEAELPILWIWEHPPRLIARLC